MNAWQWVNAVIISVGIPAIVAGVLYIGNKLVYIGRQLQVLDNLKSTTDTIKHNLKVVTDHLTRHDKEFEPGELKAFSPLNLTEGGLAFISELGFDDIFEDNKLDFWSYIDGESPKLKYDVENASIKSIYALSDKAYMDFLKVFFYNNPTRNLGNVAPTLGVFIRDKYLAEHPEITR